MRILNKKLNELKEKLADRPDLNQNKKMLIETNLQNGDINAMEKDSINELKGLVTQKDNIITELRNSNGSLMHLLEEKSMNSHGNKVCKNRFLSFS